MAGTVENNVFFALQFIDTFIGWCMASRFFSPSSTFLALFNANLNAGVQKQRQERRRIVHSTCSFGLPNK